MRDAVATMGNILPNDVGGRDAVHVAVISVIANENLAPGEDVGVIEQDHGEHLAMSGMEELVGIVDPFIKDVVTKGQRFWLYLYPRTITGLNHHWTHPNFPEKQGMDANKAKSEEWLKQFCRDNDVPDYDRLLEFVVYHHDNGWGGGKALYIGDMDTQADIPDEFWDHIEVVTGLHFEQQDRAEYFRCAC